MIRLAATAGLLAAFCLTTPVLAVTAQEKAATCKVGADHEKLTGAKRQAFLAKCAARGESPARRAGPKKKTT
jgi:hypothetical protein